MSSICRSIRWVLAIAVMVAGMLVTAGLMKAAAAPNYTKPQHPHCLEPCASANPGPRCRQHHLR
jgi:hypothetical protein